MERYGVRVCLELLVLLHANTIAEALPCLTQLPLPRCCSTLHVGFG